MERKHWTPQEDQILQILVQDIGYVNWTLVSLRLSQKYTESSRTGKQCRERWFNHLDKNINKYSWTDHQEQIIFEMHKAHGNKWKLIAKSLQNRTQNDIKNHFYATLRKGIRRMNKFIGFKKNPNSIRSIKPSILSEICLQQSQFSSIYQNKTETGIVELIFKFSKAEQNSPEIDKIMENEQIMEVIQKVLQKILQKNIEYEDKKTKQKEAASELKKKRSKSKSQQFQIEEQRFDISDFLCLNPIMNLKIQDGNKENMENNEKEEQVSSPKESSSYYSSFIDGDEQNFNYQ